MNVSEVRVGVLDAAGTPIEVVYVKNAPSYAIYGTHQRVMVHLADELAERATQQEMLATLNPLRNEINALIDGWRTSPEHEKQALTRLYDRRVADALALAFEGNPSSAQTLLKSTLDEISEERQSRGRIQHLLFAGCAVIAVAAITFLASLIWGERKANPLDGDINALLFAAAIGAVGALVSIAIAIQERRLATDLQPRDNITDAVLRIAVGSVGALLLIAMIRADLINLDMRIGPDRVPSATQTASTPPDTAGTGGAASGSGTTATTPSGNSTTPAAPTGAGTATAGAAPATTTAGTTTPTAGTETGNSASGTAPVTDARSTGRAAAQDVPGQRIGKSRTTELLVMLVIAFFAGFTERMVSRLAERINFREVAADLPPTAAPQGGRSGGAKNGGSSRSNGGATDGGPGGGGGGPTDMAATEEGHVDGCIADVELSKDDLTDDSELPETTGGVEESRT